MKKLLNLLKKRTQSEIDNQRVRIKLMPMYGTQKYQCVTFKGEFDLVYQELVEWYDNEIKPVISSNIAALQNEFKDYTYKMCIDFNKQAYEKRDKFLKKLNGGIIKDF